MPPTRLVILGDPVSQARSPRIQSAAIAAAGLNVKYDAMRVTAPELERAAAQLRDEGAGGNVTAPHKIAFRELCGRVTQTAERIGAVNTFWTEDGMLVGDNTDVGGFDAPARELLAHDTAGRTVAVIGAGGAASAVLAAIESWRGAKAKVFSRNRARADSLAERFGDFVSVVSTMREALSSSNFVVNATPIGMTDDSLPFAIEELPDAVPVMDLVYKSGGTALARAALAGGHPAADGTAMLLEQGALAFERWFGFAPDKEAMRAALG